MFFEPTFTAIPKNIRSICSRTCSRTCSCSRTRTEHEQKFCYFTRTRTEREQRLSRTLRTRTEQERKKYACSFIPEWDASSPWSFRSSSAWRIIKMATIGKTQFTLKYLGRQSLMEKSFLCIFLVDFKIRNFRFFFDIIIFLFWHN